MKNLFNVFFRKSTQALFFIGVISVFPAYALGPFSALFSQEWDTVQSFSKQVENHIEELKKRKASAIEQQATYKAQLDAKQKSISSLKERSQRARNSEAEFINQELLLANKSAQVLTEIVQTYQELKDDIDAHIKLLQEYKADPEFKNKGFQIEQKSIYSIDDFQKVNTLLLSNQNDLTTLEERLKKISADYDTLKKNLALARQEYEEKKKEQKELKSRDSIEERAERRKMTLKQRGELLDAEEHLLGFRKDLADLKIKEANQRAQFIEQNIKIARLQIEMLDEEVEQIRKELRIDKKDLVAAQNALKQQLVESSRLQEDFAKRIESLNLLKQGELNQIHQIRMRLGKSEHDMEAFYNWTYQPATIAEWNALIEIGRLHDHIVFEIDVHKDLLQARIEQEKAKVAEAEVNNLIIQTWHNLTTGMYDSYQSVEVQREIKQYEKTKADIQSSIASLTDKANAASRALTNNTRVSDTIKGLVKLFREQRDTVFKIIQTNLIGWVHCYVMRLLTIHSNGAK